MLLRLVFFLFAHTFLIPIDGYGFDSGSDQDACGRQYRSIRMHKPPCDLTDSGYCTSAGTAYPWHAVKRFVRENQGLMRRMYGDQSHEQVLKAELNLIEDEEIIQHKQRYGKNLNFNQENNQINNNKNNNNNHNLKEFDDNNNNNNNNNNDDILNTKFIYSDEAAKISIKLVDLKSPHFRPTTKTTTTTIKTTTTTTTTTTTQPITTTTTITSPKTTNQETMTESTTDATTFEGTTETVTASPTPVSTSSNPSSDKSETILFQDMDENRNRVHINYQMRGVNACPVKEEVVAPFWANNTRGEVLALLNMYPFEQYVHWEKCTHEHRQMYCRDGCRCEQQYRLHRLLAYDPNNECRGIFSDWFRFPSCCVCKCYSITSAELRVTSRSPRANEINLPPDWYHWKNKPKYATVDHG